MRFVWKSVEVGRFGRQQHQQRPEDSHGTRLKHRDKLADSTTNQQILPRIYTLQYPSVGSTCSEMSNMRTSNPAQSQMQKKIPDWHKKCLISRRRFGKPASGQPSRPLLIAALFPPPCCQWHATASSDMNSPKDHCRRNPETCRYGVHNAHSQAPGCPRTGRQCYPLVTARSAMPKPGSDFANLWSVE